MADLAIDPNAVPYGEQIAQAPPPPPPAAAPALPSYFDLRQPQAPSVSPSGVPPAAPASAPTAVQTTAPPPAGAPAAPAGVPAYDVDPKADEDNYQQSQIYEQSQYDKNVLSHKTGRATPIDVNEKQHPEWENYNAIMQDWKGLSSAEQRARAKPVQQMWNRIQADTKRINADNREKRRAEAHGLDAPRLTPEAREKTASLMEGYVQQEADKVTAASQHANPAIRRQNEFELKTSPITTMTYKDRDGKTNLQPFRDAVTSLAQLNDGVSNDQIVRYGLALGSPVGFDDTTGKPLPGMNEVGGKKIAGKGATNYRVLGRDAADNWIVEMPDQQQIRIPPQTYRNLQKARERGYENAKKWREGDKAAKEQKGLGTRILETIIPPKGF